MVYRIFSLGRNFVSRSSLYTKTGKSNKIIRKPYKLKKTLKS